MSDIEAKTAEFLTSLPFFAGLAEKDVDILFHSSNSRVLSKNQNLFHQGDKADRLFIIINGWVKLYRHTVEGVESVISVFTRGDILGEAAIITGSSYPFSAQAVEDTKVIEISGTVLKAQALQNHEIMARIMASMTRELRNTQMENEHLALMSAPQRVGCLLLQLSTNMVGNGGTFLFPYDKSLAAARLGMKPETFSRALAQLKSVGVEVKGPEVSIRSFKDLIEFVCNHCSSLPGECRGSRRELCDNHDCKLKNL